MFCSGPCVAYYPWGAQTAHSSRTEYWGEPGNDKENIMSIKIELYKVFIASPGNLENERKAFRQVLRRYNEEEAVYDEVLFFPIFWERAAGGIVRPQDKINTEIDDCDYMVLILGDRWGSAPGVDGNSDYSSATEEEFYRALRNYHDENYPMKEIVVFFKDIDQIQLDDPGAQLSKVIEFKKKLESEKQIFFRTFENENDFKGKLVRTLGEWVRNHNRGGKKIGSRKKWEFSPFQNKHIEHIPFPREKSLDEKSVLVKELNEAKRLGEEGDITLAEQKYESLIISSVELSPKNDYAKFLFRIGKLGRAEQLYREILDTSDREKNTGWTSRANANLALIARSRGELDEANRLLEISLMYNKKLEHLAGMADNYRHLASIKRIKGDLETAKVNAEKSLKIFKEIEYGPGIADACSDLGVILRFNGDYDRAKYHYKMSFDINKKLKRISCQADNNGHIGTIKRMKGDLVSAEECYNTATEINLKLNRKHGLAKNMGDIGMVLLERMEYEEAKIFMSQALELSHEVNNQEMVARHLSGLVRLYLSTNNYKKANSHLESALIVNKKMGAREGIATIYQLMGSLQYIGKQLSESEISTNKALIVWEDMNNILGISECYETLAFIERSRGNIKKAVQYCNDAIKRCKDVGAKIGEGSVRMALASIHNMYGENDKAKKQLSIARKIYGQIGIQKQVELIDKYMADHRLITKI